MRILERHLIKKPIIGIGVLAILIITPLAFLLLRLQFDSKVANIERIAEDAVACDAQTIACAQDFIDNKSSACGAFKSLALDNLLSRDDSPCKGMDRDFVSSELDKACTDGCTGPTSPPVLSTSPTASLTPTLTQSPNITSTTTITPSPTAVPTLTKAPTAGPSVTLAPTAATATTIEVSFKYPGIGTGLAENTNPVHPGRGFSLILTKNATDPVPGYAGSTTFDGKIFHGTMHVLEQGNYTIGLASNNTLISEAPFTINPGQANTLPQLTLTPGDLDQNNALDVFDFNILVSCYGDKVCSQKDLADLNDDGVVDSKDLNILLRSFALRT